MPYDKKSMRVRAGTLQGTGSYKGTAGGWPNVQIGGGTTHPPSRIGYIQSGKSGAPQSGKKGGMYRGEQPTKSRGY